MHRALPPATSVASCARACRKLPDRRAVAARNNASRHRHVALGGLQRAGRRLQDKTLASRLIDELGDGWHNEMGISELTDKQERGPVIA